MLELFDEAEEKVKKDQLLELKEEFPCPLCQKGLEIKETKNKKPYCICLECGIQLFFRGKEGIKRLNEYLNKGSLKALLSPSSLSGLEKTRKALLILEEMEKIKKKIGELGENMNFWESLIGNEEKEMVIKLLKADLERLSKKLKEIEGL